MTVGAVLLACAVAAAILLAGLGLGGGLLRLLRVEVAGALQLWLAVTVGLGTLSVATLLLGLAGLLHAGLFALLLLPPLVAGLWLLLRSPCWLAAARWLAWQRDDLAFRSCAYVLLLICASTVVWIGLTHALMPPHEWDEVAYHMTLAKLYVLAQRVVYVPFIVHSNWPMNSEMLFAIGLLFGSELAGHLVMLGMALLTAAGMLVVAHRYFDDRVGLVAVAVFLLTPLVKRLAGTGLIDVAPALYVLAVLVALDRWQDQQRQGWLVLAGLCAGFAAGSKLMGGGFPLVFGLLVLLIVARRRPLRVGALLRAGLIFGLAGLVVAGPWYARSFLFTGNPIWPFAYHIFGGRDWDELGDEYHMHSLLDIWALAVPRTPLGLLQAFWYMLARPEEMGGYRGGLGLIAPLGGLLAGLLAGRAPRLLGQALLVCLGFFLLWFAFVSHQLRFLLPIVPLLALAAGYLLVWLYDQLGRLAGRYRAGALRVALLLGFVLLLAREWPWAMPDERALLAARWPYLSGQQSREAWLDTQIDSMPLFRYANEQLPPNARVLLLPYENRTYYLDRPYVWGHPISQRLIPFERFGDAPTLSAWLRAVGVTHVIDNPAWSYEGIRYWQHDRDLMLALANQCGQPLLRQGEAVLYALVECRAAAGVR